MSKNYTDAELQVAISKLLRTSVTRPYGSLGNRRTDVVFGEVQDAAAGVFVMYSNAPFYVVKLGTLILSEYVASAVETLGSLLDAVRSTDRFVSPVDSISSLANARSALDALSGATSTRTSSLTRITDIPAYKRFDQSTQRFLSDHGKNINQGGNILQTPQEARASLAGLVFTLMEVYEEILRRSSLLRDAVSDYDSLNLPATLSSFIIANSRNVIAERFNQLDELSAEARLEPLRDVVLDVLATRSAVRGFGALDPTTTFLYFDGQGTVFADATHPATAATTLSEFPGPYVILGGTSLDLVMDGVYAFTVYLPESYVATLDSYVVESYIIVAGTNDLFTVSVEGIGDFDVALPPGTLSAQEVADAATLALPVGVVEAFPYGPQYYLQGEPVDITVVGMVATFVRSSGLWDNPQLPVQLGDWVLIDTATNADNLGWYNVTDASGLPNSFEGTKEVAPAPVDEAAVIASLNRAGRAVRITYTDAYAPSAVAAGEALSLPAFGDPIKQATVLTLGFVADASVSSQRTPTKACVDFINQSPPIAPGGVARLVATQEFEPTLFVGPGAHTIPTDPLSVVLPLVGLSVVDVTLLSGFSATFSGFNPDDIALVTVGDYLAVRSSATTNVGLFGAVTSIGTSSVDVLLNGAPVDEVGATVEIGPDFSQMALPGTLVVQNTPPGLNDGTYTVLGVGGILEDGPPFELLLDRPLPAPMELGSQPRDLGSALLGQYFLRLSSRSTLLDTKLEVLASSTAGNLLWSTLPLSLVGSTPWWSLPSAPAKVELNDVLELRDTGAQQPTITAAVVGIQTNPNLLELDFPLPTVFGNYNLGQDTPTPSGRVRKQHKNNYVLLSDNLEAWLNLPAANSDRYFGELRRLLNPLIVNSNPKASDVQTAVNYLGVLDSQLSAITSYLGEYDAPLVEPVDRLLDTFQQQGAIRAVDLLLSGQFSVFFGLSQDEVSYLGDLTKSIRDVNVQDLPQSKFKRNPGGDVIDSYEEPDFEYDFRDTEAVEEVQPPGEAYDYDGESAF